ncbi:RNase adapter RapZ [Gloeobacter violaceus]|uniref:Nucleotide-binding protein glr4163 n=1 Tax=Gloeobacter violaceus (strain ATCC 29082 / PCC 7421) TaxID=251221 RepID=Y4163_GLOVI|nr:RNase adapter RapZ [Gloeobacter violaceus]Q7NDR9.1 RecName: Full=Nucleotide-binding protein glr4163 [Gloeobacter violaceus PCC 7421]BAC92104.1 glr4163 [Gloeobacter violaceus PCC 7421]
MTSFSAPGSPVDTVLLTSPAGAGRTEAIRIFEDLGYLCLNHVWPELVPTFLKHYAPIAPRLVLCLASRPEADAQAGLIAARVALRSLARTTVHVHLDCPEGVLLSRYALTRRPHPWFDHGKGLLAAIRAERTALEPVRALADEVVDTGPLELAQLRVHLGALVGGRPTELPVTVMSFGFKRGVPADAQFVLDIRFLPNPYYESALKPLTGLDVGVAEYVFASEQSQATYRSLLEFLRFLLHQYRQDRRSQLLIAIGCTGGQHRSVAFVERLSGDLAAEGFACRPSHRDLAVNRLQELSR